MVTLGSVPRRVERGAIGRDAGVGSGAADRRRLEAQLGVPEHGDLRGRGKHCRPSSSMLRLLTITIIITITTSLMGRY